MSRIHVPTLRSGHAYGSFQIRVLNANLQNFEVDWRARYRRIASLIRQQRPQIIGLQVSVRCGDFNRNSIPQS